MTTNPYSSPEHEGYQAPAKASTSRRLIFWLGSSAVILLLVAFFLPNYRSGARPAARRMQCSNHLKQIGLALQNYHDVYGSFPPAYTTDESGKPLHSWRTLILPFAEHKPLYDQLDLSRPWDDPANRAAFDKAPSYFHCPSTSLQRGQTTYLAVATSGGCFEGSQSRSIQAVSDRSDLTLLVVEVPEKYAVHWMEPRDFDDALLAKITKTDKRSHPGGGMAVAASAYTMFLKDDLDPATFRALCSIAGGDDAQAEKH